MLLRRRSFPSQRQFVGPHSRRSRSTTTHEINADDQLGLASSSTFNLDRRPASLILAKCRLRGASSMHAVRLGVAASASIAGWLGGAIEGGMTLRICAGMNRGWMVGHLLLLLWWWHGTLGSRGVGVVGIAWGTAEAAVLRLIHGQTGG